MLSEPSPAGHASDRPLAHGSRQLASQHSTQLPQRVAERADLDLALGAVVLALHLAERWQLGQPDIEPAPLRPDPEDEERGFGVSPRGHVYVIEAVQQKAEALRRETPVVARVSVNADQHHRADDAYPPVIAHDPVKLTGGGH